MQYIPCNSALLAQETLFLTQKGTFFAQDLQKVRKSRQNSVCSGLKFSSESKLFGGCHLCSRATSATLTTAITSTITILIFQHHHHLNFATQPLLRMKRRRASHQFLLHFGKYRLAKIINCERLGSRSELFNANDK